MKDYTSSFGDLFRQDRSVTVYHSAMFVENAKLLH